MRSRDGCCADWPKPCSYHEGWQDAENWVADQIEGILWPSKDAGSREVSDGE
jgi:hypothetical protein